MRIAVWNNLGSGGGKRALYNHVKGLVERGYEVVSFCPDTANTSFMPLSDLVEEHVLPLKKDIEKRTRFLKNMHPHIHQRTYAMLEHCKQCAELINKGGFDVLFANSSTFSYIAHIARYVNLPKFIYLGEPCRYLYEAKPEFIWKAPSANNSLIKYPLLRIKHMLQMYWYSFMSREEYISAKAFDMILVNSFFSREAVKRAYNLESKVCYLGIDTDAFTPGLVKKGNYVMGMGYIQSTKGIETAIYSLAKIDPQFRPPLVWVGNNPDEDEYVKKIKQLAASTGVELIIKAMIPDEELLTLLAEARVFLYFPNLEPFGLSPLEANACGTAVVSIAEGGPRESIKNGVNGFLVNDVSYTDIADCVLKFFKDEEFAVQMGKQSRAYILSEWSLTSGTDNLERWIQHLMSEKSVARI